MVTSKIVLFGGTFDPVHLGHTKVASHARRHIGAEKVIFIPAKRSPLKGFMPRAGDEDRLAMLNLATEDDPEIQVSDCELKKPAPSYTLDTIKMFGVQHPRAEFYWLVGADGVDDLRLWHNIADLLDACNICTMYRGGYEKPDFGKYEPIWGPQRVEKLQKNVIETPLVELSSTAIRRRIAEGKDVSEMLHPAVVHYIEHHNLYARKQ
jgi:nicotinate-nucleotide adenylyltransferase